MLNKMCKKTKVNQNFFAGNALLFVASTFFFSRLFFVIAEWRDYKYLIEERFLNFFLMTEYNMSFIGGVVGFLLVLIYKLYRYQQTHEKYLDVVVVSFFFAAIIGYMAALLGGQIYGKPTSLPIGIVYQGEDMNIPYTSAVIPLAFIYLLMDTG
jgi:prolipoprotein diacylglyceryltransferase